MQLVDQPFLIASLPFTLSLQSHIALTNLSYKRSDTHPHLQLDQPVIQRLAPGLVAAGGLGERGGGGGGGGGGEDVVAEAAELLFCFDEEDADRISPPSSCEQGGAEAEGETVDFGFGGGEEDCCRGGSREGLGGPQGWSQTPAAGLLQHHNRIDRAVWSNNTPLKLPEPILWDCWQLNETYTYGSSVRRQSPSPYSGTRDKLAIVGMHVPHHHGRQLRSIEERLELSPPDAEGIARRPGMASQDEDVKSRSAGVRLVYVSLCLPSASSVPRWKAETKPYPGTQLMPCHASASLSEDTISNKWVTPEKNVQSQLPTAPVRARRIRDGAKRDAEIEARRRNEDFGRYHEAGIFMRELDAALGATALRLLPPKVYAVEELVMDYVHS
ncbi:hypothetical protein GE09DRAFT_1048323 [Coniochaeta sp. 2T2.1]|nr:hypothetical protein GE09DRAFT_1048323 [Coniochaeta sp. 2T2.1]